MTDTVDLMQLHAELHKAINDIDEKLDSQTDSQAAGKRKITSELIEANKESWEGVAKSLIDQLSGADIKVQIGIFYGLIRELNKTFSKPLSDEVDKLVEAQPKEEVEKIPEDEMELLAKTRSELYGKVKSLITMADNFGLADGMEMPRKRTGKKGKRGPRAITAYTFTIGDKSYDKLKEVQEAYESSYAKVSDLTKAIRAAKFNDVLIDLTNPPERFEFTLPDGEILIAEKDPEKVPVEDPDADDGDDDDSPDDETPETPAE